MQRVGARVRRSWSEEEPCPLRTRDLDRRVEEEGSELINRGRA